MLRVNSKQEQKVTFTDTHETCVIYPWHYKGHENDVSLEIYLNEENEPIPLPAALKRQLFRSLEFPKNQPHADFCCFDYVHWLKEVYEEQYLNNFRNDLYTLERVRTDLPFLGQPGDIFIFYRPSDEHPLHAFMKLKDDLYVWKCGSIGGIFFSNQKQLVDVYHKVMDGNLATGLVKWKVKI